MDNTNYRSAHIRKHLENSCLTKQAVVEGCSQQIDQAARVLAQAFQNGNKLLICGNGGSAADCQHLAAEFVSRLTKEVVRRALPALALTTDSSFLTAFTNDISFEGVFARQIEAFAVPGDILLGISTSGSSPNVVAAAETAKGLGLKVITLTGEQGSLLSLADVAIAVPSSITQYIQESHLAIYHILVELVEEELFSRKLL